MLRVDRFQFVPSPRKNSKPRHLRKSLTGLCPIPRVFSPSTLAPAPPLAHPLDTRFGQVATTRAVVAWVYPRRARVSACPATMPYETRTAPRHPRRRQPVARLRLCSPGHSRGKLDPRHLRARPHQVMPTIASRVPSCSPCKPCLQCRTHQDCIEIYEAYGHYPR